MLEDYTRRYYDAVKRAYESKFIKYVPVAKDSEAFISMYSFEIDDSDDGRVYEERLNELTTKNYLSGPEQVEEITLKKRKLQLKDKMETIVRRYREQAAPPTAAPSLQQG